MFFDYEKRKNEATEIAVSLGVIRFIVNGSCFVAL